MADLEAVCFDLDGTLCVREQSLEEVVAAVFDRVDVDQFYTAADVRAVDPTALPPAESPREFYEHSIRAIAENVGGDTTLAPRLADATVEVVDETAVTFREGAREALEYARERYKVALVTNGVTEIQRRKLQRLGVAGAFDATVVCDPQVGLAGKPDPEPFDLALADLATAPGAAVNVGDSHGVDVVGARDAGLASVWVPREAVSGDGEATPADGEATPGDGDTAPDLAPTHRLDSMAGLPDVL